VLAQIAALQTALEGVDLPAEKADLIRYAGREQRDAAAMRLLERLPEGTYSSLDDVGEALAPVQPSTGSAAVLPRDESGLPPGGDDYVNPDPESGAVRHDAPPDNPPQKAIEQQTKTQNEQKERQERQLDG
jgi:Protein of unknown function (DUF2795)